MRVMIAERNINFLFDINDGDIFKYLGDYFIAGLSNFMDHSRKCWDIARNCEHVFYKNVSVEYWHGANVKLLLSDKEC